jgi:hypothetical protein
MIPLKESSSEQRESVMIGGLLSSPLELMSVFSRGQRIQGILVILRDIAIAALQAIYNYSAR